MKYKFPSIERIEDVLPHIEGCPEFSVTEKDGYIVINYQIITEDTFPATNPAGGSAASREKKALAAAIRRECRGITFNDAGYIVRRPFHKFFNVNEKVDTQSDKIPLDAEHEILDKLDGSMIAPFIINGEIVWGTKAGKTDVGDLAADFVELNPQYYDLAREAINLHGMTPIFEFCSRKQKIVLDYSEDQMILIAMRNMISGEYASYGTLLDFGETYNVPVVNSNPKFDDTDGLLEFVSKLVDAEGFVVRFADGHMVKVKSDWYVAIHKAKEAILRDRNIVQMWLDNKLDDVFAHLPQEEREGIEDFLQSVHYHLDTVAYNIADDLAMLSDNKIDRKSFALGAAKDLDPFRRALVFRLFESYDLDYNQLVTNARELVYNKLKDCLTSNKSYDSLKEQWFPEVFYNEY